MKEITANDLKGFVKCQIKFEEHNRDFYKSAMTSRKEGTIEYEKFSGGYYGHLHTINVLNDILKLLESEKE